MSNKIIRVGGSHIGNATSLNNLKKYLSGNHQVFIVVSAIPELLELLQNHVQTVLIKGVDDNNLNRQLIEIAKQKTTNQTISKAYAELALQASNLLKGIALIGDYSDALKDQVLSYAERLSAVLFQSTWNETELLLPEEISLVSTADFGNSTYISADLNKLSNERAGIFVIPGTYGITENGKVARTGKTAADYTAAFLTREFKVERLELWGLDNDFLRADQTIIDNPKKIERLTYAEASELAYFDHYSFHPRTVEPLEQKHIPIVVLNPESPEGLIDTVINTETYIENQIVKSIACTDDISLLKLDGPGVGLKPGILAKVTSHLNESGLNIKSVITSQTSINFILNHENGERALELIKGLGFSSVTDISVVNDVALIGIVGHGMQHAYGVSAKIFSAVASNKINVVLSGSGASDLVSYLVVNKSDKAKSVREIYKAFYTNN